MVAALALTLLLGTIWVAILGGGATMMWRGLRGRQIDNLPRCRRCRYNVASRPRRWYRCPECGANLQLPGSVRLGVRRKHGRSVMLGVVLLLVGLSPAGALVWRAMAPAVVPAAAAALPARAPGPPPRAWGASASAAGRAERLARARNTSAVLSAEESARPFPPSDAAPAQVVAASPGRATRVVAVSPERAAMIEMLTPDADGGLARSSVSFDFRFDRSSMSLYPADVPTAAPSPASGSTVPAGESSGPVVAPEALPSAVDPAALSPWARPTPRAGNPWAAYGLGSAPGYVGVHTSTLTGPSRPYTGGLVHHQFAPGGAGLAPRGLLDARRTGGLTLPLGAHGVPSALPGAYRSIGNGFRQTQPAPVTTPVPPGGPVGR